MERVNKSVYEIDGADFGTLEEFYGKISQVLIPGAAWGKNLNAFNDILRGGFGTPDGGFVILWKNSEASRRKLGYAETVRHLEDGLAKCHRSNRSDVQTRLEMARNHIGPTVYDWIVEIIRIHGVGGEEAEDGVELVLE
jgi:RNAse (barnase) inhibitor barstar